MLKTFLTSAALIIATSSSALAGPATAYAATTTLYGRFACIERAKNKLYSISATSIKTENFTVWGYYQGATMGLWCRGEEVIVFVAGENATAVRDELRAAF